MSDPVSFPVHNLWARCCFGLMVGTLLLLGCSPTAPEAEVIEPTVSSELSTATAIPATLAATAPPVATATPPPTAMPQPTQTPTSLPMSGPDLAFYFYWDRQLFRYDLLDWSSQAVPL
ncbi:MAG: hypothetical protein KDE59_07095, partial [Anaerolineales bacterium]|nr:hypothetical protein [Anaerolineales bacterium]